MIAIDNILISDAVVQQHFVCDLTACKGACCIEGENGAPLEPGEAEILGKIYPSVKSYLTEEGRRTIEEKGCFALDRKGVGKTPLMNDGACAYIRYERGVAQCAIQKAFEEGKTDFIKPVSCHLYPIRITGSQVNRAHVNYEEWEICDPACKMGKNLKVPLYKFVKDALVRKFGEDFYRALEGAAEKMK